MQEQPKNEIARVITSTAEDALDVMRRTTGMVQALRVLHENGNTGHIDRDDMAAFMWQIIDNLGLMEQHAQDIVSYAEQSIQEAQPSDDRSINEDPKHPNTEKADLVMMILNRKVAREDSKRVVNTPA